MPETVEPVGKDRVPFFNLTESPKIWADDFLKMEAAQIEFQKLKTELEKIRKAPLTKSDLKKKFKNAYREHRNDIAKQLAGLLSSYGADTFGRLPHLQNNPINSIIPQDIFEAALELLPPDPPNAMGEETRQKKIDAIQKKMNDAKEKIKKYTPQAYVALRNGNVQCDSRREFVNFWRNRQAWIARPCNIQGIDLAACGDDEKWAYEKLGIAKNISPKAVKLPYRP